MLESNIQIFILGASTVVWNTKITMPNLNTRSLIKHLPLYALLKVVQKDIIMNRIWTNINGFIQKGTFTHALLEVVINCTPQKVH